MKAGEANHDVDFHRLARGGFANRCYRTRTYKKPQLVDVITAESEAYKVVFRGAQ